MLRNLHVAARKEQSFFLQLIKKQLKRNSKKIWISLKTTITTIMDYSKNYTISHRTIIVVYYNYHGLLKKLDDISPTIVVVNHNTPGSTLVAVNQGPFPCVGTVVVSLRNAGFWGWLGWRRFTVHSRDDRKICAYYYCAYPIGSVCMPYMVCHLPSMSMYPSHDSIYTIHTDPMGILLKHISIWVLSFI